MHKLLVLLIIFLAGCQKSYVVSKQDKIFSIKDVLLTKVSAIKGVDINLKSIFGDKELLVVAFWQQDCPCVKRYIHKLSMLEKNYESKIKVIYVASGQNHQRKHILQSGLHIYYDYENILASELKISSTPGIALLHKDLNVYFVGWFDNERSEHDKRLRNYLAEAIDSALKKEEKYFYSPIFGCPFM